MTTETVVKLELVDATKATLRQAIRAACLHEEGMQQLEKAGEGVSGVLHRTAVEVYANAVKVCAEAKIDMPDGASLAVYFAESLADAEASLKEESSAWKHMQKLPRAWINAKSIITVYFEYNKMDFTKHSTVSSMAKFNKLEKQAVASAKASALNKEAAKKGLSLIPPAAADAAPTVPTAGGHAQVEKHETQSKSVNVTPVNTSDLDPVIADLIAEIAELVGGIETAKAVKMLNGFKGQLSGVAKNAMLKMASNG